MMTDEHHPDDVARAMTGGESEGLSLAQMEELRASIIAQTTAIAPSSVLIHSAVAVEVLGQAITARRPSSSEPGREGALARWQAARRAVHAATADTGSWMKDGKGDAREVIDPSPYSHLWTELGLAEQALAALSTLAAPASTPLPVGEAMRELIAAAKPFVANYAPWMDAHTDETNGYYAVTNFGQQRRLRSALAALAQSPAPPADGGK